jgi:pyruvate/2-oxoglutarate dehydrogenase complex dihydrolipoamide dehydrogenase (E3) component
MEAQNTDVMVIGLGVGGEVPAGKPAEAGLHVTGVEAKLVAVDQFTAS